MNDSKDREDRCLDYIRTLSHEDLVSYAIERNFTLRVAMGAVEEWRQSARSLAIGLVAAVLAFIGMTVWAGVADTRRVACESRAEESLEDAQAEASRQVQEAETRELDAFRKLEQLRERK